MFVAELNQSGNASALDCFVIRRACAALDKFPDLLVSVNVDACSISDWKFVEFVERELSESGLSGERLILEVTETHEIVDLKMAKSVIERFAACRVRCALDDLGAGFNTIALLKQLPFHLVKLDGDFIRNLPQDPYNQHLIGALKHLADGLGFEMVGERIETVEEWNEARRLGVTYGQGHWIGAARDQPYQASELNLPVLLT